MRVPTICGSQVRHTCAPPQQCYRMRTLNGTTGVQLTGSSQTALRTRHFVGSPPARRVADFGNCRFNRCAGVFGCLVHLRPVAGLCRCLLTELVRRQQHLAVNDGAGRVGRLPTCQDAKFPDTISTSGRGATNPENKRVKPAVACEHAGQNHLGRAQGRGGPNPSRGSQNMQCAGVFG
jgi:hypothetical protein